MKVINAKKETITGAEALSLARQIKRLRATKGKKIVEVDRTNETLEDAAWSALIVGPSGNLRAPTLQVGSTWLVGFSDELYQFLVKR